MDGAKATVLAKIEGCNPSYAVKSWIGAAMVWDAENRAVLGPLFILIALRAIWFYHVR